MQSYLDSYQIEIDDVSTFEARLREEVFNLEVCVVDFSRVFAMRVAAPCFFFFPRLMSISFAGGERACTSRKGESG